MLFLLPDNVKLLHKWFRTITHFNTIKTTVSCIEYFLESPAIKEVVISVSVAARARARCSQSQSHRSLEPEAARAEASSSQNHNSKYDIYLFKRKAIEPAARAKRATAEPTICIPEFSAFILPSQIHQVLQFSRTKCQRSPIQKQLNILHTISISSDFPPSVGDIPDRDIRKSLNILWLFQRWLCTRYELEKNNLFQILWIKWGCWNIIIHIFRSYSFAPHVVL